MSTLKADPAGIRAKATKINGDWPAVPASPVPPDMLELAGTAAKQIVASRDRLNSCIEAGKAEAARLAACMEAAATAYEQVDEIKKGEIESGQSSGTDAVTINPALPAQVSTQAVANTGAPGNPYADWVDAARQLEAANYNMLDFKAELYTFADAIRARAEDFSPGDTHWEGLAAEAAEGSMRRHESWLYDVATKSSELAEQCQAFVDAHITAQGAHPAAPAAGEMFGATDYANNQHVSEEVRGNYSNEVTLQPVDTPDPPAGAYAPTPVFKGDVKDSVPDARKKAGQGTGQQDQQGGAGDSGGAQSGESAASPASAQTSGQGRQSGKESSGSGGSGSGTGESPSGGQGSGGSPSSGTGSPLPEGLSMPTQPTLRPASAADGAGAGGGGAGSGSGGGGGGGGAPTSPLAPAAGASSPSASPAAAGGGTAPVGTPTAAGGMMGGMGGMGGHGMGGQGQGGTEKRRTPGLAPDEELYVEDRAHTESVIGLRPRRRDGQDKEST